MVKLIGVPEKLLRDYASGMANHKLMKSSVINILEEYDNLPEIPKENSDGLTAEQKIKIINDAVDRKEFALKEGFEEDFILSKKGLTNLSLTQKQDNRLDEIWRKYKRTIPDLF